MNELVIFQSIAGQNNILTISTEIRFNLFSSAEYLKQFV